MNLFKIEQMASKVRADFEANIIDESELKSLYQKYNPIDDIDIFMAKAKKMFPNLNCGLASIYLQKLFSNGKIVNGKYKNNNHTFLMLKESIIIDITSDQYGGPRVYVGPLQSPWSLK